MQQFVLLRYNFKTNTKIRYGFVLHRDDNKSINLCISLINNLEFQNDLR